MPMETVETVSPQRGQPPCGGAPCPQGSSSVLPHPGHVVLTSPGGCSSHVPTLHVSAETTSAHREHVNKRETPAHEAAVDEVRRVVSALAPEVEKVSDLLSVSTPSLPATERAAISDNTRLLSLTLEPAAPSLSLAASTGRE